MAAEQRMAARAPLPPVSTAINENTIDLGDHAAHARC
jgi:hypothetical protein